MNTRTEAVGVEGTCAPGFEGVRREFERNFAERGDTGASVAVIHDGEVVVELWGGTTDLETGQPWQRDTMTVLQSCTKGAVAMAANLLVARGALDLDEPVSTYWPEYRAGKEDIPVRWLLGHRTGTPVMREAQPPGALLDWEATVAQLAAEEPFWEPGSMHAYHAVSFGYLVGELVRRVDGRTIGTFVREELAEPLGADLWIGLPEEHESRVARSIPLPSDPDAEPTDVHAAMGTPGTIQNLMVANTGGLIGFNGTDERAAHAAELPSTGGISTALGLATLYAPLALGGAYNGVELFTAADVARIGFPVSSGYDRMLMLDMTYTLGFWRSIDARRRRSGPTDSMVLSTDAFGHPGLGGRLGFADPGGRFSFGYTTATMADTVTIDLRGQALVDATYQALGYRGGDTGHWTKG